MVTPVFRIFDYQKALEFYVDWLGFRIDWADQPRGAPVYLQISRGDVVVHLTGYHGDCSPGAKARAEMQGLLAYHHQLLSRDYPLMRPKVTRADWNERVLEMEVIDPFGNRLIFCEPAALRG